MKTTQIAAMILFTGTFLFTACSKEDQDFVPQNIHQNADFKSSPVGMPDNGNKCWKEDFTSSNSLTSNWILFGEPLPKWVESGADRQGLFDNNGSLPNGSFAISRFKIGNGNGYTIESDVCIDMVEPISNVISPGIGITRYLNLPTVTNSTEAGIFMRLVYIGKDVAGVPKIYQNHTYIVMSSLMEDGTIWSSGDYTIQADYAGKGWHNLKILVDASKQISFYLDDQYVLSPKSPIHASLLKNKNVMIGFASPGNGGKAYHDSVKVTYLLPDQQSDLNYSKSIEQ